MPAEFDKCIAGMKAAGKGDSAYPICVAQYKKKHGKSPFKSKKHIDELPINYFDKKRLLEEFERDVIEEMKRINDTPSKEA